MTGTAGSVSLIPPGPGVLIFQARPALIHLPNLPPVDCGLRSWDESAGLHRLFPYRFLRRRTPGDGGPPPTGGEDSTLPGFSVPIRLDAYMPTASSTPRPMRGS